MIEEGLEDDWRRVGGELEEDWKGLEEDGWLGSTGGLKGCPHWPSASADIGCDGMGGLE